MSNNFKYGDAAVSQTTICGDTTEILAFNKYEDFLDFHCRQMESEKPNSTRVEFVMPEKEEFWEDWIFINKLLTFNGYTSYASPSGIAWYILNNTPDCRQVHIRWSNRARVEISVFGGDPNVIAQNIVMSRPCNIQTVGSLSCTVDVSNQTYVEYFNYIY